LWSYPPAYFQQVFPENIWISAVQNNRKEYDPPLVFSALASLHIVERSASCFPLYLRSDGQPKDLFSFDAVPDTRDLGDGRRLNLSDAMVAYLERVGGIGDTEALFHHVIAALHAPTYREENAGALRQDWPRVPLPAQREALLTSAELGRQLAVLLDSERTAPGVTSGQIREELRTIGVLSVAGGGQINPDTGDLDLTAGWGYAGRGGITMPGKGRVVERLLTEGELNPALGLKQGGSTFDIYLNQRVFWRNVPPQVWTYIIGGYQVLKKWLSYRERPLLGRSLRTEEARELRDIARRIAAILLLEPALDMNYRVITRDTYSWSLSREGDA
jgi:hypothetical protein